MNAACCRTPHTIRIENDEENRYPIVPQAVRAVETMTIAESEAEVREFIAATGHQQFSNRPVPVRQDLKASPRAPVHAATKSRETRASEAIKSNP